jgi:hypothetical protein
VKNRWAPPLSRIGWVLDQLAGKWTEGNARTLVHHLAEALACPLAGEVRPARCALRFRLDLTRAYLGGMGEGVGAALVGGSGDEPLEALEQFAHAAGGGLGFPLAFCVTEDALQAARLLLPERFSVAIGPADLAALLDDQDPLGELTRQAAAQISRVALSVYRVLRPADVAFFGRDREQSLLFDDLRSSYAIAGPGRIGKSSLMKRHARNLRRRRDPRTTRLHEIDLMAIGQAPEDEVARFLAVNIRATRRAERVTASDLTRFLRECRSESDGPLELLLDETDLVCEGEAFRQLGQSAKDGSVRLVLCGRKRLYDFASRESSPLGQRLVLMRLSPLSETEARALLLLPMRALGLSFWPEAELVRSILNRTGRLPHLIQYYAKHLVELTNDHGCDRITSDLIDELESREDFLEMFLAPLEELSGRPAYDLARALLRDGRGRFETADIRGVQGQLGRTMVDAAAVRREADELVVANLLSWDRGGYRVISPVMRDAAREAGFLD